MQGHAGPVMSSHPLYVKRVRLLGAAREWFQQNGFAEVDTPVLTPFAETSPHLTPFETRDGERRLFLATSPEYGMKQVLGRDLPQIYQISHFFRQGEHTPRHTPEFLGAEWYRLGADYAALMQDCYDLTCHLARAAGVYPRFAWQGHPVWLDEPFAVSPLETLFKLGGGKTATQVLEEDGEEEYFLTLLNRVEPRLTSPRMMMVSDYPAAQGLLARRKADAPHLAERFEMYLAGVELANGWTEETTPAGLAAIAARDKKAAPGRVFDTHYLKAAQEGRLPPCAGVALGLERLMMVLLNAKNITDLSPLSDYLEK